MNTSPWRSWKKLTLQQFIAESFIATQKYIYDDKNWISFTFQVLL